MNLSTLNNKTKNPKKLLYTKMKIFHFKEKLDSLTLDSCKILSPLHIRIKPTNVCNHNCIYCAYKSNDDLQLGKDMVTKDFIPREKMMEIIGDIKEMDVKAITFSGGGEPFIYPYFLETIKELIKDSIKFASLTNGSKLEGEIAELFAHHATWLRISIDGWDDESYSFYRRVPFGEFTRVMRNMEQFKRHKGKCYLGVSIVVDKHNAQHIYELVRKLREIGVDSVKIAACIVSNSGTKNNEYHKEIFMVAKDQIFRSIRDFISDSFEIFDAYHELEDKFTKDYSWCPYLQILPVIGADLNIYPCQDKAYNFDQGLLGSIRNMRFSDFWFSDKNIFFKLNPSLVCNHHCVANEKNKMIIEYLNTDNEHSYFV